MSCLPLPRLPLPDFAYMSPALNSCTQLQLPERPTKTNFAYMAPALNPCTQLQLPKMPAKTNFAYVALASYPCTAFVYIFRSPLFIDQKSLKPPGKSDVFRLLFSTQADICTRCWSFTSSEVVISTNLVQEKQAKIIYAKVITLQSVKPAQRHLRTRYNPAQGRAGQVYAWEMQKIFDGRMFLLVRYVIIIKPKIPFIIRMEFFILFPMIKSFIQKPRASLSI